MTETKIPVENYRDFCGAHERNRTFTPLRMADFESAASTNSATWAFTFREFFKLLICLPVDRFRQMRLRLELQCYINHPTYPKYVLNIFSCNNIFLNPAISFHSNHLCYQD